MKRLTLAFMFIATVFAGAGNKRMQQTEAAGEEFTNPNNYIVIGADYTDPIWITKTNSERPRDYQERNAIIFFNANPKFEIAHINRINYRITSGSKTYDGKVQHDKNYTANFLTERGVFLVPIEWAIYRTSYTYENGVFVTDYEERHGGEMTAAAWAAYTQRTRLRFPEMGKSGIIKQTINKLGEINDKIPSRLLWQYKTSKTGFNGYNAYNTWNGNKNYEYYLILPIETASEVKVEYLSLEAYDIHGNKITDEIKIDEVEDFEIPDPTPGTGEEPPATIPLDDVYKFSFIKEDGKLKDNSAVYFPGSNKFQLVGFHMTNYETKEEGKNPPVYIFAGDLVGKKTIELADAVSKEWQFTSSHTERRYITYKFQGRNNSLLVDIPLDVTDLQIDVYFQRLNIDGDEDLVPFYFNLVDNDGNYGILGGMPEDEDPNKDEGWQFPKITWPWEDNENGIFGTIQQVITGLLLAALGILLIVLVFRVISLVRRR